jgi:hypothetical protein
VGFDLPTPSFIFIALFFFTSLQFFKKVILSPLAFATVLLLCSFSSLHFKKKLFYRDFVFCISNGHSPQIRQNGKLLVRMCRGESHFSQKALLRM